ncbi:Uncharacterised protein [Serratia marcescens]|nr:Uncharacterised protein [Serratia marcescens]CUZ43885.1 Uncharacterised protein [Serratia marcescens]CVA67014.1 Uncharacterised protein [Serratia marcescens]
MALAFKLDQHGGGDRFDFGNDIVRPLLFDNGFQRVTVQHIDDVAAVRHVHGGGVGIAIDGDHFQAEALAFNGDFFTQLPGAEQHNAGGGRAQGGSNR